MKKTPKPVWIIIFSVAVVLLMSIIVVRNGKTINNFEDCVAAGNPVMESYPRQCRDPLSDRTFTEELEDWQLDTITLMQHESEGYYGCFGCGIDKDGQALCIDPIIEMKPVQETSQRHCDSNFEVIQLIGGDRDEYGCLPAAGYSWNETEQMCVREWTRTYCTTE